jgi:hypothetical protein
MSLPTAPPSSVPAATAQSASDHAQYAQADVTSRSRAGEDLVSFAQDLDAFISSANPNVPAAAWSMG